MSHEMIYTTRGEMSRDLLAVTHGREESADAMVDWVEYRQKGDPSGEVLRRDVHITLKQGLPISAEQASL